MQHADIRLARATWAVAAFLAFAAVAICASDLHFIWDGAHQFQASLVAQRPFFHVARFHSYIVWLPMVWMSQWTENVTLLGWIYALPFALAPLAGVILSWWIVRRPAPWLILWPVLGIAAGTLPGQVFIINDSIFQQHLFWPVFLGMLVPLSRWQGAVLALLALFQLSHPIGLPLMAGTSAAAAFIAWKDPARRRPMVLRAGLAAALAAVCAWKIFAFPDAYVAEEMGLDAIRARLIGGLAGFPIAGLLPLWIAAALLGAEAWRPRREPGRDGRLALGCLLATALIWTIWAAWPHFWNPAINYRRWIVPMCAPFFLLALIEGWRAAAPTAGAARARAMWIAGALFAVVLTLQSIGWSFLTHRLEAAVAAGQPADLGWTEGTPLQHWGTSAYIEVLERRAASQP